MANQETPEIVISLSDLHLSEGLVLPSGEKNIMEDFERDAEFAGLIGHLLQRSPESRLRLQFLGDTFDPLMIPIKGRADCLPFQDICLEQLEKIILGHPVFFEALIKFSADPRTEVYFYIGNHDLFLDWTGVQERLVQLLSSQEPNKIKFTFQEIYHQVFYFHGNIEPHNATDLSERYLMPIKHNKLREPLLNYPYGSYMTAALMPKLRRVCQYVGRLQDGYHGYFFKEAALGNWRLGVFAIWIWLANFFSNRFFAFWNVRKKSSVRTTFKILAWLFIGCSLENYSRELLARDPKVRWVVCGHEHIARSKTVGGGQFLNTGTWALSYNIHYQASLSWLCRLPIIGSLCVWMVRIGHRPVFVREEKMPVVIAEYGHQGAAINLWNWNVHKGILEPYNDSLTT